MDARRGRLRRSARTLAAATTVCVAVGGAAVVLEAAVLGKPARDTLVAAAILRKLDEFRLVDSNGSIGGHRFRGVCYQGWFRVASGGDVRKERGAGLLLGNGAPVVEAGNTIFLPRPRRRIARVELRLDCPRVLADAIAFRLARGTGVEVERERSDYRLGLRLRQQEVEYRVSARTLVPVAAAVRSPTISARSVLRDGGLTKRKLARLRHELRIRFGRRWAEPA